MVWVILVTSFLTGLFFIYGGYLILAREKIAISFRLQGIKDGRAKNKVLDEELEKPFVERVIKPTLNWISNFTKKFTPAKTGGIEKVDISRNPEV